MTDKPDDNRNYQSNRSFKPVYATKGMEYLSPREESLSPGSGLKRLGLRRKRFSLYASEMKDKENEQTRELREFLQQSDQSREGVTNQQIMQYD